MHARSASECCFSQCECIVEAAFLVADVRRDHLSLSVTEKLPAYERARAISSLLRCHSASCGCHTRWYSRAFWNAMR